MNKYTVLPLLNSSFEPGKALETVEQFEDKDFRNIAMAELYYFTGKAKECCEITELYLENEKMELRLSACMLYCYANLTLGRSVASKRGLQGIQECISKAMKKEISEELQASCVLAGYVGAVLLHLPAEGIPPLWEYSGILSEGLRLFAVYVLAHQAYLNGEYWSAYGMCKAALFMTRETYPISMVYLRCMMSTCRINRRYKKEAQIDLMEGSTRWRTVSDQKNRVYFFESTLSPDIFWIDLKGLDFSSGAPVKKLSLTGGEIYAGNAAGEFRESEPFPFLFGV